MAEGRRRSQGPHLPAGREGQFLADGRDRTVRAVLGNPLRFRSGSRPAGDSFPTILASVSSRSGIWCSCSSTATRREDDAAAAALDRHGHGLERIAAVLQGKLSNYDTDLLRPIIDGPASCFKKSYGEDERTDTVLRINADHARATAFLIHDGVLPSNEGRGYVLRKIMRRAMRNARHGRRRRSVPVSTHRFRRRTHARRVSGNDGEHPARGARREGRGASLRDHVSGRGEILPRRGQIGEPAVCCPAPAAFKLYDTYGLALEEQEEMARESGLSIDREGFTAEMEKQRTRARASWKGADKAQVNPVYQACPERNLSAARRWNRSGDVLTAALDGEIALDRTPFYAEAGGQVGDTGCADFRDNRRNSRDGRSRPTPRRPARRVHRVRQWLL